MGMRLGKLGMRLMLISSVFVAVYSLRYIGAPFGLWAAIDDGIRGVITAVPVRALTHMLIAPIALLVGPFQFLPNLRAKHPKVHRYLGRIYIASCVIAGIGALATVSHASGGPVAGLGFGILAVLWIGTSLGGWWAAVQRRFELHRLLMRLSYAMTFGAVTLRLQIPIGFMLGSPSYSAMSVWLAYTSWIPNVLAVLIYESRIRHAIVRVYAKVGAYRFAHRPASAFDAAGASRALPDDSQILSADAADRGRENARAPFPNGSFQGHA